MGRPQTSSSVTGRSHALTEGEIRELADAAVPALGKYGPEFRAVLLFLAYVGCRPGELCCIRRADVDRDRAEVTIRCSLDGQGGEKRPKNGRPRVVTVPPPALAALTDVPNRLDSVYLFHTTSGHRLSIGMLNVVANQLGHTDGGALVQRLYGHPSERGMRQQQAARS